ncbi:MAG: zinc ribbon domain-containing protein, partial [Candidatus Methanomethylophilaceae archaeon]|nr:zinc ribbon domain-containing protein [Candidatus Methanomethylophilaceae archaeon]
MEILRCRYVSIDITENDFISYVYEINMSQDYYCSQCGNKLEPHMQFCPKCGTVIAGSAAE